ncbi:MAG: ATP-binding protein [Thermoanaerobaculia bacterium]
MRARAAISRDGNWQLALELALLLAPGVALVAGTPVLALLALSGWIVWWFRFAPPSRERWLLLLCGGLSAALLSYSAARELARNNASPPSDLRLEIAYRAYWSELAASADRALAVLPQPPFDEAAQLQAFELLGALARDSPLPALSYLLLDSDRQPVAWGGAGLLHDVAGGTPGPPAATGATGVTGGTGGTGGIAGHPDGNTAGRTAAAAQSLIPADPTARGTAASRQELLFRQSAASASALVVRRLPARSGAAFELVTGESRSRFGAPPLFGGRREAASPGLEGAARPFKTWGFGRLSQPQSARELRPADLPALSLELQDPQRVATSPDTDAERTSDRRATIVVGLALFGLAALRGFALAILAGTVLTRPRRLVEVPLLGLAGVALLAIGFATPLPALSLLLGGLGVAACSGLLVSTRGGGWSGAALLALGVVPAITWLGSLASPLGLDLGADLALTGAAAAVRLGLAATIFGTLILAARSSNASPAPRGIARGVGVALILLSAALHDHGAWTLLPLVSGTVIAARSFRWAPMRGVASWASILLVAVAVSATAWEIGFRLRTIGALERPLAALAPISDARRDALAGDVERYFAALDVAAVLPDGLPLSDEDDLAYVLWRQSPLARLDAISALVIERPATPASSFSYGLPLTDALDLDLAPARWSGLPAPAWRDQRIAGEGALRATGRTVGRLRYWLVPRPGFGAETAELGDLAAALLRGGPARPGIGLGGLGAFGRLSGLLGHEAAPVLYTPQGEILSSPWREGTPALARVRASVALGDGQLRTPEGSARVFLRESGGAAVALFARELAPIPALERVGVHAAGALFAAALLCVAGLLLALPRATARDLFARMTRSYANRLILLFSLLLLVPLVLLYSLLSRTLENRILREQRVAAEAALSSAQRVLGEYVLTLEPGFGLATAIDDQILVWLSRVTGHEISLYWGSEVYASSKRELFAAGLLPRRIPGEVWPRMALAGENDASRTARTGSAEYLELYAPLAVPGFDSRQTRLFLSMPLLAQQEEATAETALIRRRTLLATLAVFLLLAGLGTRLARAFTRPIMELVGGTQRIAAGASALGVKSSVLELAALAEAIDRMARRLAEGRDQLVREKRLVDGIIENVTSGVVYMDRSGRVLLANRLARQLLEVAPGDRIEERLARRSELAPAGRFVAERRDDFAQSTVRLASPSGTEGKERDWSLVWVPLAGEGEPAALFVVEDISEVLRAQRLEAWASMAQIIAHEIKNPLTPIRLSTEHLREVWKRDRPHFEGVFERCTENILRQVEELREIASEFSTFSRIPKSVRKPGDLAAVVREIVDAYRAAPPPGVDVALEDPVDPLPAKFDARLLGRALRNLLENAIRVSAGGGKVTVSAKREGEMAVVRVFDHGPGVPPEMLGRIFEPYFSTQVGGTGLGLSIAQRVAEEHGGAIAARNLAEGGLEVAITIPLI